VPDINLEKLKIIKLINQFTSQINMGTKDGKRSGKPQKPQYQSVEAFNEPTLTSSGESNTTEILSTTAPILTMSSSPQPTQSQIPSRKASIAESMRSLSIRGRHVRKYSLTLDTLYAKRSQQITETPPATAVSTSDSWIASPTTTATTTTSAGGWGVDTLKRNSQLSRLYRQALMSTSPIGSNTSSSLEDFLSRRLSAARLSISTAAGGGGLAASGTFIRLLITL
jgi:hypothetical protein